jgi:Penicillin-Binding Protein C-terminus Family
VLPARYAAWRARSGGVVGDGERVSARGAQADASAPMVELEIESPRHGDRFAVPGGAEAAYATVAHRASGKHAAEKLAWSIDGQRFRASRWRLTRGEHTVSVRAPSGVTAVATVVVQYRLVRSSANIRADSTDSERGGLRYAVESPPPLLPSTLGW